MPKVPKMYTRIRRDGRGAWFAYVVCCRSLRGHDVDADRTHDGAPQPPSPHCPPAIFAGTIFGRCIRGGQAGEQRNTQNTLKSSETLWRRAVDSATHSSCWPRARAGACNVPVRQIAAAARRQGNHGVVLAVCSVPTSPPRVRVPSAPGTQQPLAGGGDRLRPPLHFRTNPAIHPGPRM